MERLQKTFLFDKIIIVPSKFPPGKSASTDYEKRLEWCRSIYNKKYFEVSSFEKNASQTIFARDIVSHFAAQHAGATFHWILGQDQWNQLSYWHLVDSYAPSVRWVVMTREREGRHPKGLLSRRLNQSTCAYEWAAIKPMPGVSSSKIRQALSEGLQKTHVVSWIPPQIRRDVVEHYQPNNRKSKKETH